MIFMLTREKYFIFKNIINSFKVNCMSMISPRIIWTGGSDCMINIWKKFKLKKQLKAHHAPVLSILLVDSGIPSSTNSTLKRSRVITPIVWSGDELGSIQIWKVFIFYLFLVDINKGGK